MDEQSSFETTTVLMEELSMLHCILPECIVFYVVRHLLKRGL